MTTTIRINDAALRKLQRRLERAETDTRKAISAAVNDTLRQCKTRASQEIRKQIALPKAFVDKRLNIRRASPKREQISGILYVSSKPVSLSHFNPIQKKEGAAVRIRKSSREMMPHTFGPKRPRLRGGVYIRRGAGSSMQAKSFRAFNAAVRKATGKRGAVGVQPIHTVKGVVFSEEAIATGAVAAVLGARSVLLRKNVQRRLRLVRLRAAGKAPPAPARG